MEWVLTAGKTVEEAVDAALDELGVDLADAEIEVIAEPKQGLFGRTRGEAQVRARVRPTAPRPKLERRDRRRRPKAERAEGVPAPGFVAPEMGDDEEDDGRSERPDAAVPGYDERGREMTTDQATLQEQGELAREFVEGLVDRIALTGTVTVEVIEEDTVEVRVAGDELGLLIGPKGQTLSAVQELTRTVVQRRSVERTGRLVVDVAGYRQRRREALERFTRQVAADVVSSGIQRVLEAMPPADRKVVHDTANGILGVHTTSEGEEPRRRVVIQPDGEVPVSGEPVSSSPVT